MGKQQNKVETEISPEMIEAGAMELWLWLGDGRTQNEPMSQIEAITTTIISAALGGKGAS